MIVFKLIITGLVMGFVSALPVGPSALEIVRRGVLYGFKAAFWVALGTVTSDILYSMLALFGVSHLIINNHIAEEITGGVAAIVIIIYGSYIVYEAFKNREFSIKKTARKELPPYLSGLALTIFNPFVLVYWSGIVSLVLRNALVDGSQLRAGIFIAGAVVGIVTWTLILSKLASLDRITLNQTFRRSMNFVIGGILVLAGLAILGKLFVL